MPITRGAKKAHRSSLKKRGFNVARKDTMKVLVKNYRALVKAGKSSEATTLLPKVFQSIDKPTKRGVIKPNKASRDKSRLSVLVAK